VVTKVGVAAGADVVAPPPAVGAVGVPGAEQQAASKRAAQGAGACVVELKQYVPLKCKPNNQSKKTLN
jgi:hypothetical protein